MRYFSHHFLQMKRAIVYFFQFVVVLIGLIVLAFLIWFPRVEGRAKDLDTAAIYLDPFILYAYAASIVFFVALGIAFRFLGYIGQNKVYSRASAKALRGIKRCAFLLTIAIIGAAVYISLSHHPDDDPAGFIAMSLVMTVACIATGVAAAMWERKLKKAVDMK